MRRKSQIAGSWWGPTRRSPDTSNEQISEDLKARGVDASSADLLASRMVSRVDGADHARYEAMLDGAALSCRAQADAAEELNRGASELREVERLVGSFATELGKLDEILEVLAAYLSRMRVAVGPEDEAPRVLH
jgi:hypothetical protein